MSFDLKVVLCLLGALLVLSLCGVVVYQRSSWNLLSEYYAWRRVITPASLSLFGDFYRFDSLSICALLTSSSGTSEHIPEPILLFTSSSVSDTCNPSWTTSALLHNVEDFAALNTQVLTFSLSDSRSSSVLIEYSVDLSRIVRLGNVQLMSIESMPVNSLFFSTDNGYHISESLFFQLRSLGLIPVASRFVGDDELDSNESNVLREKMKVFNDSIHLLKGELDSLNEELHAPKKLSNRISKQHRINQLRKARDEQESAYLLECHQEEAERLQLCDAWDLSAGTSTCHSLIADISKYNKQCHDSKVDLLRLQFLFESRQLRLISELQCIYPIERGDSGEYSIRGVELHLENSTRDDEQVSTALGYVVHLLLLISKYLEINLRYQLLFYASRSMIRDSVSQPTQTSASGAVQTSQAGIALPLYRRGIEKERFDLAVQWLKSDVEQLLCTRGVLFNPKQGLLFNIQQIFTCDVCSSLSC